MSGIPVRLEREGDIGLILVDHPPANVLSPPVRQGLLNVIAELASDPHLSAGVIAGAGRSFMAGVDVREFDSPPVEPVLAAITAALEALAKPIVASMHGSALGGGFEIALACHGRVIAPDGAV
ncbi:MAG TPA: enoyl-CoA hydratase/isomerase family protein, partial [Acetobacteraceae bacterium]|nr:enoyl-CoA hydratase/isomerase family protein [Acetobacteraceae bacterium]